MTFSNYLKIYQLGYEDNKDIFKNNDDEIVIQEKIDGGNFRFMFKDNQIIFGSHTQELSESQEHKFAKNFVRCINFIKEKIKNVDLKKYEGMVFYGECCVKHSIDYNWDLIPPYLGFDINNENNINYHNKYIPYPQCELIFKELELPFVPIIKIAKVYELRDFLKNLNDSVVPKSKYYPGQCEGIIFKNYNQQIFAKYVTSKFKEVNHTVFGGGKKLAKDDNELFIATYCTNSRIDKIVFKFVDIGEKLSLELMHKVPIEVYKDIWEENFKEIYKGNWTFNFKKLKSLISKRCLEVIKTIMINNSLNEVQK